MEFTRAGSLGYQVNLLARMMARSLGERIRPFGVAPGQFAQLLALYDRDGQTVTELAAMVEIEYPTMSRTIDRMERDGLVERRSHPTDGRSRLIHLTPTAWAIESDLKEAAGQVNAEYLAAVTTEAGRHLLALLEQIAAGQQTSSTP